MADIDYIRELAAPLGDVTAKRMFGGWCLWADGIAFALVADDTLWFKVDAETAGDFEARELPRFEYTTKDGRRTVMSYARAPEEIYDDPDVFSTWARAAVGAARRADAAKTAPKAKAARGTKGKAAPAS